MTLQEDTRPVLVSEQNDAPRVIDEPLDSGTLGTQMRVRKRDGSLEPVNLDKIVKAVARCATNTDGTALEGVDIMRVATRTISGLVDGATTEDLDELSIRTSAAHISEEPNYSQARRPPARHGDRQGGPEPGHLLLQPVGRRSASPRASSATTTAQMVATHARKLNDAIRARARTGTSSSSASARSTTATCCAIPSRGKVTETPQYFLMRVACGLSTLARGGHRPSTS